MLIRTHFELQQAFVGPKVVILQRINVDILGIFSVCVLFGFDFDWDAVGISVCVCL